VNMFDRKVLSALHDSRQVASLKVEWDSDASHGFLD